MTDLRGKKKRFSVERLVVFTSIMTVCSPELVHTQYKSKGSFSQTVSLQNEMEDKLTERFVKLFQSYMTEVSSYSKTFMYVCDKKCRSQNIYGHGLTSAFLLAVLSERKFLIYQNINTPFYGWYDEAGYPWKAKAETLRNQSFSSMLPISRDISKFISDLQIMEKRLSVMEFDLHFKTDVIYLDGDYNWVLDLRRHPNTAKKIPWLYKTHAADLVRLIHNGLFRLSPSLRDMISNELTSKVEGKSLACFHGKDINKNHIQTFSRIALKKLSSDFTFYISGFGRMTGFSDRSKYRFKENNINIDFNKFYKRAGVSKNKHVVLRHVIEVHILKLCDILIVSDSPTGIIAAQLRRKEDNLYCFRNGVIFPCTRSLIAGSFLGDNSLLKPVDMVYFCNRNDTECIVEET